MRNATLEIFVSHLTADDDPRLWEVAATRLLAEAAQAATETREEVYAEIGCCHHWIRPHQNTWLADGGFASPFGYNKTVTGFSYRALPEFTWRESVRWTGNDWEPGRTGRRCLVFRVAVPARTARHKQAAIHTIWTPRSPTNREKLVELFGFRKRRTAWVLTAREAVPPRR